MNPLVGKKLQFNYPYYGTPDTCPEYTAHSGQVVKVLRQLAFEETETEMYEVEAEDGWKGHVNRDELTDDPELLSIQEVLSNITECLAEADGDTITDIHNRICTKDIEYIEDSLWKVLPPIPHNSMSCDNTDGYG